MNKWLKYALIITIIGLLIIGGLSIYIKNQVMQRMASLDFISCDNFDLNLLTGCLDVENIQIDHPFNDGRQKLTANATKIHLHGFNYWQYYFNHEVGIKDLIAEDVALQLTENEAIPKTDSIATDTREQTQKIEQILVDNFQIKRGKFILQNKETKELSLDSFTINMESLAIRPQQIDQTTWKNLTFYGNQFLLDKTESLNRLSIDEITLDNNKTLVANQINWTPKYSKTNYIKHIKHRKAWLRLRLPQATVKSLDVSQLVFNTSLKAQAITLANSVLQIYTDKNIAACTDCQKTYPYEDFIAADMGIAIDNILIKDSKITLEELGQGKEKSGKLDWTEVYASVYNLSNNQVKAKQYPATTIDVQAVFVKDAHTKLHFEFPNLDKQADYRFSGSIDHVDLSKINRFLVFSKHLRIKKGLVSDFTFKGSGNSRVASGEMTLRYRDLELQFLKNNRTPRKFLSKIANGLLSKKNNPDKKNILRKGKMYHERLSNKSFFNNWWNTLQSGIKSTMLPNIFLSAELKHDEINK